MARHQVLIGTYTRRNSEGIYGAVFDDRTGALELTGLQAATDSPSFLTNRGDLVFAVNELDDGGLSAFRRSDGKLAEIARVSSRGSFPCHIASGGDWVAVANYGSGSLATFGTDLSAVDLVEYHGQGPNTRRQASAHAHQVFVCPDERHVIVPDLGSDKLHLHEIDRVGRIGGEPIATSVAPGSGPRHVVLHPDGTRLYLINELSNRIDVLRFDTSQPMRLESSMETLDADFDGASSTAEIEMSAKGNHVYGSNRGENSLVTFTLDAAGNLHTAGRVSSGGDHPRHFCFDPSEQFVLIANQDSDNVVVRRMVNGVPADETCRIAASMPVHVLFPGW